MQLLLPVALFALLTVALVTIVFTYRTLLVWSFRSRADVWARANPAAEPAFVQRAHDAHKNCVETLPVLIAAAWVLSMSPAAQSQFGWMLSAVVVLRALQSLTHLAGTSHWHVFVRGLFFSGQLITLAVLLVSPWLIQ